MLGDAGANALGRRARPGAVADARRADRRSRPRRADRRERGRLVQPRHRRRAAAALGSTGRAAGREVARCCSARPAASRSSPSRARVVGFGRTAVLSRTLGTSCVGDVYTAANAVPNVVFEVVAGGALAALVVPLLAARSTRATASRVPDRERAADLDRRWCSCRSRCSALLAAPLLVRALLGDGPALRRAPSRSAPGCCVVFLPQVVLYGVGIVLAGVLQAHRRFLGPALAPLLSSLVVVDGLPAVRRERAGRRRWRRSAAGRSWCCRSAPRSASPCCRSACSCRCAAAGSRCDRRCASPPGVAARARGLARRRRRRAGRPAGRARRRAAPGRRRRRGVGRRVHRGDRAVPAALGGAGGAGRDQRLPARCRPAQAGDGGVRRGAARRRPLRCCWPWRRRGGAGRGCRAGRAVLLVQGAPGVERTRRPARAVAAFAPGAARLRAARAARPGAVRPRRRPHAGGRDRRRLAGRRGRPTPCWSPRCRTLDRVLLLGVGNTVGVTLAGALAAGRRAAGLRAALPSPVPGGAAAAAGGRVRPSAVGARAASLRAPRRPARGAARPPSPPPVLAGRACAAARPAPGCGGCCVPEAGAAGARDQHRRRRPARRGAGRRADRGRGRGRRRRPGRRRGGVRLPRPRGGRRRQPPAPGARPAAPSRGCAGSPATPTSCTRTGCGPARSPCWPRRARRRDLAQRRRRAGSAGVLERLVARRAAVDARAPAPTSPRGPARSAAATSGSPRSPRPPLVATGRDPGLGRPLVLAVGRLHPQKGYDVLLAALPLLGDAVVAVAGDGPARRRAAGARAGGALARPARRRRRPARRRRRRRAAVACGRRGRSPPRRRCGPAGRWSPPPSAALPGLVGDGAVLVPPGDPAALGAAVRALLDDPAAAAALAARGRAVAAAWPDEDGHGGAGAGRLRRAGGPVRRLRLLVVLVLLVPVLVLRRPPGAQRRPPAGASSWSASPACAGPTSDGAPRRCARWPARAPSERCRSRPCPP